MQQYTGGRLQRDPEKRTGACRVHTVADQSTLQKQHAEPQTSGEVEDTLDESAIEPEIP